MNTKRLDKHLTFFTVFAFAVAGMIASGLFLLPGLVYHKVGSATLWVYGTAGILIIPTVLSKSELATALPRAGGAYYVIDRTLGPVMGTVAGIGTWLSLVFKSSFDLIGIGAYLVLFLTLPIKPVAIGICVGFAILSITGSKHTGRVQEVMVGLTLAGIVYFLATGIFNLDHGSVAMQSSWDTALFLEAIGLVYVSFASLTKIISVAEEVEDLEKNLPGGMFTAVAVTLVVYILGVGLIMYILPHQALDGTLTPVADTVASMVGDWGAAIITIVAVLAFSASANAGLAAASRYPLAMSRDNLAPARFATLGRFQTPTLSILLTTGLMVLFIIILSPESVAKLASAFLLVIFGLLNLSVIVLRESKMEAYDPGFRSPLYPWLQIVGIISSLILIPVLGMGPRIAAGGIIGLGILWYFLYGKGDIRRPSVLSHIFSRVGQNTESDVDRVLRHNLRERGLREEDSLDDIFLRAAVLRAERHETYQKLLYQAALEFAERTDLSVETVYRALKQSDDRGNTPMTNHIALPHTYITGLDSHEITIVQVPDGLKLQSADDPVFALFILLSPPDDTKRHLRLLAEIANRAEDVDFTGDWREMTPEEIQRIFVKAEKIVNVRLNMDPSQQIQIRDLKLHDDCLVALIRRDGRIVIPRGQTSLQSGDILTLLGTTAGIMRSVRSLRKWIRELQEI